MGFKWFAHWLLKIAVVDDCYLFYFDSVILGLGQEVNNGICLFTVDFNIRFKVLRFCWFELSCPKFIWKDARKIMTPIIIAEITITASMMLTKKSVLFLKGSIFTGGGGGGAKVTAGVPHLWQNRAYSSSKVPHL